MRTRLAVSIALSSIGCLWVATSTARPQPKTEVLQGWLTDEQCAKARATGGKFTATNPDCAHKCVSEGKKVVFVDPVGKRVLTLVDQAEAKKNIGNYVEIEGSVDSQTGMLHADSIKFLDQSRPMCEVPARGGSKL